MLTAAELFATTRTREIKHSWPGSSASSSAARPSSSRGVRGPGNTLEPVTIAHQRGGLIRTLREGMRGGLRPAADAFSREVQRTGRSLRMPIVNPRQLELWLPSAYLPLAEGTGVCGVLAAALTNRSRVVGTLLVWRERGQPPFAEADEAYVSALATRLGLGLPRLT
jgi:hypothetical protein